MNMRFGLIGCGEIGRLRAQAIAKAADTRLIAVADQDLGRAAAVASAFGGQVDSDWRALIARDDIDAVIVSTPPSLHAKMCIDALGAGKHVLCEKPLARNSEECRAILEAAARSRRFVATGFNYRFYPSALKAREIMDSGIIGELDHIRSYSGYSAAEHNHPWLHDAAVMGGGALRDNGIHLIDLTCWFLGDVADSQGRLSESTWGFEGCEDNGFVLARNRAGKIASIHASWTEWRGYRFRVEIYGTRGAIVLSCFPMITQAVWAAERGGRMRRKTWRFPMTHLVEHLRSYRAIVVASFIREFAEFGRAVRGEASMVATGGDGLRSIEIAEAAAPARSLSVGAR